MATKIDAIDQRLNALIGLKAWGAEVHDTNDHHYLTLDFGAAIQDPRDSSFDGEWQLHVSSAMWRLDNADGIQVGSGDDLEKAQTIGKLIDNLTVTAAEVTLPALELHLSFENQWTLL